MECGSGMINGSLVREGQRSPTGLVSSRCSFEEETAQTKQAFPSTFEGKKGGRHNKSILLGVEIDCRDFQTGKQPWIALALALHGAFFDISFTFRDSVLRVPTR